jgi:hypothetical protein
MALDGLYADFKPQCDLLIDDTINGQDDHLQLSRTDARSPGSFAMLEGGVQYRPAD